MNQLSESTTAKISVLHLGLGRFHRAHQAVYFQRAADELGDTSWQVASFSMRSPEQADALLHSELRYPVLITAEHEQDLIWVSSIKQVGFIQRDLGLFLELSRSAALRLITLTITEKGYCLGSDGKLNLQHHSIVNDLAQPEQPQTAVGFLALALRERMRARATPIAVISCDNLHANGRRLEAAILKYLEKLNWSDVRNWTQSNVTFPSTMVDRIVPSLKPETLLHYQMVAATQDPELVVTENFCQWVIENHFKLNLGETLKRVGVEFVAEVEPYEQIKLCMLNAAHSLLAYYGLLRGHQFVHQAIADEKIRNAVVRLLADEVPCVVKAPAGFSLEKYAARLLGRFANRGLAHQLSQIAMDGSQKLPERVFLSLVKAFAKDSERTSLLTCVAAWLAFIAQSFAENAELKDPMRDELAAIFAHGTFHQQLTNILTNPSLVGDLALEKRFPLEVAAVADKLFLTKTNEKNFF